MTQIPSAWSDAWNQSFLSSLPDATSQALLMKSWEVSASPGQILFPENVAPGNSHLLLVLSGLVRVYRTSRAGREVTLRHAAPGDIVGIPSVIANRSPAAVQAVTECRTLRLPAETMRRRGQVDPALAWAMADEVSRSLFKIQERMVHNVFAPVSGRVARYLLDVAQFRDERHIVEANHQAIADAVGSVREVVARVLATMRDEGLTNRTDRGIELLDPEQLNVLAQNDEFGEGLAS